MEDTHYGVFINNERVVHGEVKYDRCHISRFLSCFVNKQRTFKRTILKQNCQVVKFSEKTNIVFVHTAAEYGFQYCFRVLNVVRFIHNKQG